MCQQHYLCLTHNPLLFYSFIYPPPPHSEILYLGSHHSCSLVLFLHLQDGTASLYTIVIFILSIVLPSLLCLISSGVLIPDICQEEDPEGLPVLLLYYFRILLSLDPSILSLFLLWLVLCLFELLLLVPGQAGSSPPCFLCSYPRSGQVTFAWVGLGGPSWPEQIPEVCNLRSGVLLIYHFVYA